MLSWQRISAPRWSGSCFGRGARDSSTHTGLSGLSRRCPRGCPRSGVFVDQPIDYVRGVANLVKLGAVQLHGHAPAGSYRQLPYRVIQAVRMAGDRPLDAVGQLPRHVTVLLDAYDPVRVGGTGRTVDWQAAAAIAEDRRIILSGGLRAENVTEAIETVCPFGVDVASGVEERPGVKDPARLKSFFQAVRQATKGQG